MINLPLFKKELLENRVKLVICFMILAILAIFIPLSFELFHRGIFGLPRAAYLQDLELYGSTYENYAWSQWTAKNLARLSTLTAIVLGMGVVAGERARGTALFILSRPVTKREVYTTKVVAGLFMLAAVVFGSTLVFMAVSFGKGYILNYGFFISAVLIVYAGAAVIYLGTVLFSCLFHEPVKAGVAAALFWAVLSVPGCFSATAPYSLFYQMKAIPYVCYGYDSFIPLGMALVLGGICYEAGVWLWSRCEF